MKAFAASASCDTMQNFTTCHVRRMHAWLIHPGSRLSAMPKGEEEPRHEVGTCSNWPRWGLLRLESTAMAVPFSLSDIWCPPRKSFTRWPSLRSDKAPVTAASVACMQQRMGCCRPLCGQPGNQTESSGSRSCSRMCLPHNQGFNVRSVRGSLLPGGACIAVSTGHGCSEVWCRFVA
jgi:hypothetical protein